MESQSVLFYLISGLTAFSALLAVTASQLFRSAIYLLFSLIGIAAIYFMLDQDFIAAVQIIVYVGGIVVLIIFSIFLTQDSGVEMRKSEWWRIAASGMAALSGFLLTALGLVEYNFVTQSDNLVTGGVKELGRALLSLNAGGYVLPFEMVGLLLLAAMIGCIVIAVKLKELPEGKENIQ
ncbi:MAG: NADH-quinone oxidoreductase subunit J [Bacteroidia bacterium]|nr:NADH-quinone oxidoreductase subunit J [Bacteroidia bacterium]